MTARGWSPVAVCLVLLVVVPQATLAAFVPAIPQVAADLHTSAAAVDRTLVLYMGGYALSMALAGALAQRIGLRSVQLTALLLHLVASVLVAAAPGIGVLAAGRFLQALGGGAGTVLARVYVQEAFPEDERLRLLTQLSTAIAITPAVTPPVTGVLVDHVSWRPVLLCLGGLSLVGAVVSRRTLQATRARHDGGGAAPWRLRPGRAYWWFTAAICLAWCVYFTFTTFSSSTFQGALGTTSTTYGLLYGLVVLGYVIGSRAARRLGARYTLPQVLTVSGLVALVATSVMAAGATLLPGRPMMLAAPMAVAMVGVGAAFPVCQAGMLRAVGTNTRSASGMFFFLQMTSGAAYTGLLSMVDPTTPGALSLAVLVPAVALCVLVTAGRRTVDAGATRAEHAVPSAPGRTVAGAAGSVRRR